MRLTATCPGTPLLLGALAALAPAAAAAELPPIDVGARLGIAASVGDAVSGASMRESAVKAQIPVQLEASVHPLRDLAVGPYLSYGAGVVGSAAFSGACELSGVACSGHAWRAGLQARLTLARESPLLPWAGAALGWEWAEAEARDATGASTVALDGWDAALEAGGDIRVGRRLTVGPYLHAGLGRYQGREVKVGGATVASGAVAEAATHGWLGLGVAGRFDVAP